MKVSVMVAMAALGISLVGVSCSGDGGNDDATGGKGGTSAGGKGGSGTGGKGGTTPTAGTSGTGGTGMAGSGGSTGGSGGGDPMVPFPTDELVVQYKFNEGTGTMLMDSSTKGNHANLVEGTVRSAPAIATPTWVDGQAGHGKAYSFDGTNDFAIIPDSESVDAVSLSETPGMSLAAWVKFKEFKQAEALSDFNFVICRQETARPGNEYFGLGLKNGRPMVTISHFFTEAPDPIALDTWTHIALSYDGLTVTLYVNGVQTAEMGAGVTIASDTTPITIGAAENLNGVIKEFVRASVDDLHIYSRPLTGPEVKAVMAEK